MAALVVIGYEARYVSAAFSNALASSLQFHGLVKSADRNARLFKKMAKTIGTERNCQLFKKMANTVDPIPRGHPTHIFGLS